MPSTNSTVFAVKQESDGTYSVNLGAIDWTTLLQVIMAIIKALTGK